MKGIKAMCFRWNNLHSSHKQAIKDVLQKGTWKSSKQGFTSEQKDGLKEKMYLHWKKKESAIKSQKAVKNQKKDEK